ncbi:MAG TPA: DUF2071 domain-containing protein [Verrucomicrobiae bacterium]|nr:DUF2071 domain-containing protein [Verrucomicrobiae bacterium]
METIAREPGCLSNAARERMLGVADEPLFYGDWLRAVFIHYEVDPEVLQRVVPFELDLDEGRAYVSLVAFTMRRMRPRIGGKFSELLLKPISGHEFLNVRAYVRHGSETGIYFLAEWLSNRLSVALGPGIFGLPYRLGKLEYRHEHERGCLQGAVLDATNTNQGTDKLKYNAVIDPEAVFLPCKTGTKDEFLLERYTAFTQLGSGARYFRIWHRPWPQTPIDVKVLDTGLLTTTWPWFKDAQLIGANYSPGFNDVWMGRPHSIR